MDVKVISKNVGIALLVSALFMFLSMVVSIADGRDSAFGPLSISFIITFIVGIFPQIFVRRTDQAISMQDGFMIIVLSWSLSFIFGMLPYILWGGEFTLMNAWFESVSGYTTTGATILTNVEALPKSLLFWRSSTHFIGGLGVVVFLLLIMPDASPFRFRLTSIELSSLSRQGYRFRSMKTVGVIGLVYLGMNALATICLMLAGMSFFDAINHAFSTVSTGGFSTRNTSIMYYNSRIIEAVAMAFMLLSSIHFGLLFAVFATRSFRPFLQPVVKFFLGTVLTLTILVSFSLRTNGGYDTWGHALWDSAFQVCCYITTTGFGSADNANWPVIASILLMYAVFQCGCSGSTNSGVKSDRVLIAFKAIIRQVRKNIHPSSVTQIMIGNHPLKDEFASSAILYIVLYIAVFFISVFLLFLTGMGVREVFSGALSSLSNVGPGLGEIGTMGNFNGIPMTAKFIFTIDMILGRMEIYPIFVVLYMIFKHNK